MTDINFAFKRQLAGFELDVAAELPVTGVTAIFGPSGSGKTTLLRAIAGLERIAGGQLVVKGEVWQSASPPVFKPTHLRGVGYVFQEPSLFEHLSVQGNLDYALARVPIGQKRIALAQAVELLGLAPLLARQAATLSGGERQRVGIARALATSPCLLLMDEPLAALDVARKAEVLPYLEQLSRSLALPLLYVTHSLDEVARLADHLLLLDQGKVRAFGPTSELLSRLDLPLAHGDAAGALIEGVVSRVESDFHLTHADFAGGSLSWVSSSLAVGQRVRLRVAARDVSVVLSRPADSSIQNMVQASIAHIAPDSPGQVMVSLNAGGAVALDLQPGKAVFAQVKGVALVG
jgi:molybdate transport system ATP-binding protein